MNDEQGGFCGCRRYAEQVFAPQELMEKACGKEWLGIDDDELSCNSYSLSLSFCFFHSLSSDDLLEKRSSGESQHRDVPHVKVMYFPLSDVVAGSLKYIYI